MASDPKDSADPMDHHETDIPGKARKLLGISNGLTPPPSLPLSSVEPHTSMSSLRSRKSPSKVSLSVNATAANRSSDERIFDADSRGNGAQESGVEARKKAKTKRERKTVRKDVRVFTDDDYEVKALERSFLQAHFGVSSTCELHNTPNPRSDVEKHTRQASIYSHANSEISAGSGVSTETVKPISSKGSSASTNTVAYTNSSVTGQAKNKMAAKITKSKSKDEGQNQSSFEQLPSPYVMVSNSEVNGSAYFDFASNPDAVNDEEGATLTKNSSWESTKRSSQWATPLAASPVVFTQPTSPSSTYSNDVMKIPRKTVGSGSSKSNTASITSGDNSPSDSPVISFESIRTSHARSTSFSSDSEIISDEEIRRRNLRHAAYDAYKVHPGSARNSIFHANTGPISRSKNSVSKLAPSNSTLLATQNPTIVTLTTVEHGPQRTSGAPLVTVVVPFARLSAASITKPGWC